MGDLDKIDVNELVVRLVEKLGGDAVARELGLGGQTIERILAGAAVVGTETKRAIVLFARRAGVDAGAEWAAKVKLLLASGRFSARTLAEECGCSANLVYLWRSGDCRPNEGARKVIDRLVAGGGATIVPPAATREAPGGTPAAVPKAKPASRKAPTEIEGLDRPTRDETVRVADAIPPPADPLRPLPCQHFAPGDGETYCSTCKRTVAVLVPQFAPFGASGDHSTPGVAFRDAVAALATGDPLVLDPGPGGWDDMATAIGALMAARRAYLAAINEFLRASGRFAAAVERNEKDASR